ncbi:SURF1 family protein [Aquisalinus flavus]|uniref:SURF1-like protein n=1 Tax=Aquisalinus flavus TaxID=1526572 RepID=A0A8J2V5Q1_9PROT|nr:SURF1 family protein [Aquisalinus flavus]MBD0426830.1 SURF1 family protein [Aquisalinus flavus]UNE46678.1 SURF1 family protein [Aquisalinus flavus]GGC96336.1 SURF1-like protein [Aquisalinus flavus]
MTFRIKPVLTLVTIAGLGILIALGTWQLQRLEWKRDLIQSVETRLDQQPVAYGIARDRQALGETMTYTPVAISGTYLHDHERHVFGTYEGEPGWNVFTPLQVTAPGARNAPRHIWVNRGFVPDRLKDPASRPDGLVAGFVTVTGLFRMPEEPAGVAGMVSAPSNPEGNQWYVRDSRLFGDVPVVNEGGETTGTVLNEDADTGYYIDSSGAENPGSWPRGGTTRVTFTNRHLEYAWTWFGLAGALLAVYTMAALKRD